MTMELHAEFTVEPFHAAAPGPHVSAALDAARDAGFDVDFGPLGSTIDGDDGAVIEALATILQRSLAAGATRVSLQVSRTSPPD